MLFSYFFRKKRWENLLFCDHYPVITAGIQYKQESFKFPTEYISNNNVDIFYTKRGGDLTAHELGQIIIYPHIDLIKRKYPITRFISQIIEITQNLILREFKISLHYLKEMPGLYTNTGEKIVSIGLEIRKGFTSSGIAINYQNNLNTFKYIYPCGYKNLKIETLINLIQKESNNKLDDSEIIKKKYDFCKKWAQEFLSLLE